MSEEIKIPEFIDWLRHNKPELLKELKIKFREERPDHRTGTTQGILNSLEDALRKIEGIKCVDHQRNDPSSLDRKDYPGVFVNNLRLDRTEDEDEPDVRNMLTVALVGFVWPKKGDDLGTELNAFIEKVRRAVLADRTQNGNAKNTEVEVVVTDAGSMYPKGEFVMAAVVEFYSKD